MASFLFGAEKLVWCGDLCWVMWGWVATCWVVEVKRVTDVLIFVKNALIFWLFDLTLL